MTKPKNNRKRLLIFLALAALLLIAFAWFKANSKPKGKEVFLAKAEKRTIKEIVEASGKIYPQIEIKISSDVSGELVDLFVEEGDSITKGQLLAKIDPDAYQAQVERGVAGLNNAKAQLANSKAGIERSKALYTQSTAELDRIKVQLENTREIHHRNDNLFKDGVISAADFDASLATLKQLEANLRSAEANVQSASASVESSKQSVNAAGFTVKSSEASLKELNTSLRRTTIYAPSDGIVSMLNIEKGERVLGTIQMAGTELMRIANMNAMEVQVDVVENDVLRVAVGDPVEIEVDAYSDRTFKGTVTQIANSASNSATAALSTDQVTNFVVKISVNPASYQDLITPEKRFPFRPGMSASVEINTNTVEDILSIPLQAVSTRELDDDKKDKSSADANANIKEVVFVAAADTVSMVQIKTGIQDDDYIQVLSGLEEGQDVVEGPYSQVKLMKVSDQIIIVDKEEFNKKKEED